MIESFSNAIVIGANGFLGGALVECLQHKGINIVAVDRENVARPGMSFVKADIGRSDGLGDVARYVEGGRAGTVVFQLAGMSHAGSNSRSPLHAWNVNVDGMLHVLEWCRQVGIHQIVYPSTSLLYGETIGQTSLETDQVHSTSIYTASKLAVEELLRAYSKEFGMSCAVARLGNVYGRGAAEDSIAAIILRQEIQQERFCVRTLRPVRDFIYVKDVADGLVNLAERALQGSFGIYNLGAGVGTSVGGLIQCLCRLGGRAYEAEETGPSEGDTRIVLNIEKIERDCAWRPMWGLDDGLADTLHLMRS